MHSDRRGTDKKNPKQNLPDKRQNLRTKPPCEQLRENLYRGLLSWFFVLVLKVGEGVRDLRRTFLGWFPGCVTRCGRGWGVKIGKKNSVTYFMDGYLWINRFFKKLNHYPLGLGLYVN